MHKCVPMPKVALAKNITRKQALSYDRTVPNGIGVTAISAVNGRGSYARFAKNRYRQTRALLRNGRSSDLSTNGDGMFYYKSKKARPNKGMSRKQKAKCAPLVSKAVQEAKKALDKAAARSKPAKGRKGPKRKLSPKQKAALKKGQRIMAERRQEALFAQHGLATDKGAKLKKAAPKKAAPKKAAPKRPAKKAAPKKSAKKAAQARRAGKGPVAKKVARKAPKKVAKKAKFKKVTAIYVKANRKKKAYRANAELKSSVELAMERTAPAATAAEIKGLAAYRAKQKAVSERVKAARAEADAGKASAKAAKEALAAVRAQYKGVKKDKAAKAAILAAEAAFEAEQAKVKAAQSVADAKIKAAKAELRSGKAAKKAGKKRAVSPRVYGGQYKSKKVRVGKKGMESTVVRIGDRSYQTYMSVSKKGKARKIPSWLIAGAKSAKAYKEKPELAQKLAARRSKAAAAVSKKILAGTYPFTPNSKRVVTFKEWQKTMKKRKSSKKAHRNPLMQAAANKKRSKKSKRRARRNPLMQAAANKKRSKKSKRARRNPQIASYISNPGIAVDQIVAALKDGAVISGGLLAHKALTNLAVQNIEFFQKNQYGKTIAAVAVAAVGIPAAAMLGGRNIGAKLGVGMGAALLHTVLVNVLDKAGSAKAASYLGDYTEADYRLPAAGMGSYYEFQPGQVYSGMGEYIQQSGPMAGFGAMEQAAAGFGNSMLSQAAAGVGEYIVTGAEGIGEYEQVTPEYTQPAAVREGIAPSLGAAEQALSIAEAAAGVGGMGNIDLPLEQTVYPTGQALDITDAPGGSRAGVFYGGNGVFGP